MGTSICCWSCGTDVTVPRRGDGDRLAHALADAIWQTFQPSSLAIIGVGAVVAVASLCIPVVGVWMCAAVLVAGAWGFQRLIRHEAEALDDTDDVSIGRKVAVRLPLSLLAAAAIVAPLVIRNGGALIPQGPPLGGPWALPLAWVFCWLLMPVLLLVANARGHRGESNLRRVWRTFAHRPRSTLAALAIAPAGLVLVELTLTALAVEQGHLPLLLSNIFPQPTVRYTLTSAQMIYRYDGCVWNVPFTEDGTALLPVYASGLRRGYTLLAGIPGSLAERTIQFDPTIYQTSHTVFLVYRLMFSALGFTGVGLVLAAQARCLGRVVGATVEPAAPAHLGRLTSSMPAAIARPAEPVPATSTPTGFMPVPLSRGASAAPVAPSTVSAAAAQPPPSSTVAEETAASVAPGRPTVPIGDPPEPRPLVLIVDDEMPFCQALSQILATEGFRVAIAVSGHDALQLAPKVRPDLVILDLLLPDRSGLDVCRALRTQEATRTTPILMLSYRADPENEVSGLDLGANDYVAKPYVVEVLIARIRNQLRDSLSAPPSEREAWRMEAPAMSVSA